MLALLLDAGFAGAVDARDGSDRGEAVLHVACRSGAKRCAALLLRSAADARARDGAGATPRDVAARAGFADVADLVLGYEGAAAAAAAPPPRAAAPLAEERRLGRGATVVAAAETTPVRRGYASDSSRGSRDGDWPAAMTRAAPPPPPPPPPPPATFLCDGDEWQELWSEADQYAYFQHVATGHTQWDDPRRGRPPPPPAPPPPPPPPQRASRSRSAPEVLGNARRRPARDASPGRRAFATGGPLVSPVDVVAVARGAAAAAAAALGPVVDARAPAPSWDTVSTLRASPAPDWDERSASTARSWGPEPPASTRSNFSARTFESSAASDGEFEDVDIATDDGGGGGGDPEDEVDEFFEELVAPETGPAAPPDLPAELRTEFTFAPADEGRRPPADDPAVPLADDGAAAADPAVPAPAPADEASPGTAAADAATDAVFAAAADAQRLVAAAAAQVLRTESPAKPRAGRPPRPESSPAAIAARVVTAGGSLSGADDAYPGSGHTKSDAA